MDVVEKEETELSKHNYSQYSSKKKNSDIDVKIVSSTELPKFKIADYTYGHPDPVGEPGHMGEPGLEVKMELELVNETANTTILPKTVNGVVVDCVKLNIRTEPDIHADVACVLDVMSELKIDVSKSNNEWFKVSTATGVEGYCMRKFVDAHL